MVSRVCRKRAFAVAGVAKTPKTAAAAVQRDVSQPQPKKKHRGSSLDASADATVANASAAAASAAVAEAAAAATTPFKKPTVASSGARCVENTRAHLI